MKFILPCMMIAQFYILNDAAAQSNLNAYSNNKTEKIVPTQSAKLTYLSASTNNDRVLLNWAIENNKETDQFEIERSADGKTFKMIALVFGSELTDEAKYSFSEKMKKKKIYYRLKVVYKDNRIQYSDIITP